MKINGKRVTVYKDKLGPYDAYYQHGSIVSTISNKYEIKRAFDMEGTHIGIPSRKLHLGRNCLIVAALITCCVLCYMLLNCRTEQAYCVVYAWHEPYLTDNNEVALDISNLSSSDLYISVGGITYTLHKGDTLNSVPFFASEFTILYEYEGCRYEEDIQL